MTGIWTFFIMRRENGMRNGSGKGRTASPLQSVTVTLPPSASTQAGVYTFYARDRRGNDTAYTVRIADLREGPGVLDQ